MLRRRQFMRWACAAATMGAAVRADAQPRTEKSRVVVALQGGTAMDELPLLVGQRLGFFEEEGVHLDILTHPGPLWSSGAVPAPGVDVVAGPFEQTLWMQAYGHSVVSFVQLARVPQVVLGISPATSAGLAAPKDLAGQDIGVPGLGSLSHLVAQLLLQRAGLKPADARFVEVGDAGAARQAYRSGRVQVLSHTDPVISALEQTGQLRIIADTRVLRDTEQLYGGPVPATCLSAPAAFVEEHPRTCQALANGVVHALKWLQTAGPSDIVRTVPESHMHGDRALYLAAFSKMRQSLSVDGTLPDGGALHTLRALTRLQGEVEFQRIDPARTTTNVFALRAKARFRA